MINVFTIIYYFTITILKILWFDKIHTYLKWRPTPDSLIDCVADRNFKWKNSRECNLARHENKTDKQVSKGFIWYLCELQILIDDRIWFNRSNLQCGALFYNRQAPRPVNFDVQAIEPTVHVIIIIISGLLSAKWPNMSKHWFCLALVQQDHIRLFISTLLFLKLAGLLPKPNAIVVGDWNKHCTPSYYF